MSSFDAMITNAAAGITQFWLGNVQRWKNARAKGSAYKADDLAADMVGFWGDAFDAWGGLLAYGPEPLVPTVFFSDAGTALPGQKPKRSAYLTYSVPSNVQPSWTDLEPVGGGTAIPQAQVSVTVADTQVSVVIQIPAASPAPAAGLYRGVAYLGPPGTQPPRILVEIVVVVT